MASEGKTKPSRHKRRDSGETASLARFFMDIILTAGQSNFANFYVPLNSLDPGSNVLCRGIGVAETFRNGFDPQPAADGVSSSVFPILGGLITAYTKKPIGFISVAVSNSIISSWVPKGKNYPRLRSAIQVSPTRPLCVLWHNGETDSFLQTSQLDYETGLRAMIDEARLDAGFPLPFGIAVVSHPNETGGIGVRAAQRNIALTYPHCFLGANTDTLDNSYRSDNVHFNSTTGRDAHAKLWFNALVLARIIERPSLQVRQSPSLVFGDERIYR